jgi:phospholipid/cholesterol/gamma-HCH transport system substrate-binding protein
MNNSQQTARVGLFFILGIALTWVTFATLSGDSVFKTKGYKLIAGFENLKELKKGDEVRMAGVTIGSVQETHLDLAHRRGVATLLIDPGVQIPGDSSASIVMAGLIGTNYIGVELGSAGAAPLAPGTEIRTKVTPDLNSIMTDLGNLGKKLDGAFSSFSSAISGDGKSPGLFQKLDKVISDNGEKVTTTMTNLQEITTKLNSGEGTIGKLINDPALHDELVAAVSEIKSTAADAKLFVADAQAVMAQVKSGKGTIGALVYDDTAANDLKASVANIRAVSDKLAKGEGTLGKLINDDTLYNTAQNTLKKADRAIDGLGDTGPITAVGIVANSLF